MYTLKPMTTYHQKLFKRTKKLYSKVSAISSNFAIPELPPVCTVLPLMRQGKCHLVPRNAATSDLETHDTLDTTGCSDFFD